MITSFFLSTIIFIKFLHCCYLSFGNNNNNKMKRGTNCFFPTLPSFPSPQFPRNIKMEKKTQQLPLFPAVINHSLQTSFSSHEIQHPPFRIPFRSNPKTPSLNNHQRTTTPAYRPRIHAGENSKSFSRRQRLLQRALGSSTESEGNAVEK